MVSRWLVMFVSRICMTVMSITDSVIAHFRAEVSVTEGCAISVTGASR